MSFAKRFRNNWANIIATVLVVFGVLAPSVALASTSQPRDCDMNAIVFCGAYSKSEWLGKVNNGDTKHTSSNIQQIYFNEGRGITRANFQSSQTVDGTVFKDGRVVVDGKTVATDARSIGRDFMPGSVKSGSVWMRPTSTSFAADSIQAWVDMDGGTFHFFILKSCGNAGVATPTPKPTPTPTPQPKQSFSCQMLSVTRPDAKDADKFKFTITPKLQNVKLTGFRFTFSDLSQPVNTGADTAFTTRELKPGTITIKGQVKTDQGITSMGQCVAEVTVKHVTIVKTVISHVTVVTQTQTQTQTQVLPEVPVTQTETPTPQPQVLSAATSLPATGPEAALGGIAGLSAIGYAGRSYLRSRKSLLGALRGKRDL